MSSHLSEILRIACACNGVSASGSSAVLFKRLDAMEKKAKSKKLSSSEAKSKKFCNKSKTSCKGGVCKKPKTTAPIKMTKKGTRMSASFYFHEVCDGKISRCVPQMIQEPSGRYRLKEIRIVDGAHGRHPRWVLVDN